MRKFDVLSFHSDFTKYFRFGAHERLGRLIFESQTRELNSNKHMTNLCFNSLHLRTFSSL